MSEYDDLFKGGPLGVRLVKTLGLPMPYGGRFEAPWPPYGYRTHLGIWYREKMTYATRDGDLTFRPVLHA